MTRNRKINSKPLSFDLEAFVPFLMTQIYHGLNKSFAHALEPLRINPAQWRVLANLARRHRPTYTELLQYTALDQPTLSRTVARLVREGHVARKRKPGDGRAVELSLTPSGRHMWARALEVGVDQYRMASRDLGPGERRALARSLSRMLANVLEMRNINKDGARRARTRP